jgi:hypothetical protein
MVSKGQVRGRPTCVATLPAEGRPPLVLIATQAGEVAGFAMPAPPRR